MRQEIKPFFWLAPAVAVVIAGIIYFALQTPTTSKNRAPDFTAVTLNGKSVSLQDLRGKPLFLNFWSSW